MHQNFVFSPHKLETIDGTDLGLTRARTWRRACIELGATFDRVVRAKVEVLTGEAPW